MPRARVPLQPAESLAGRPCHGIKGTALGGHSRPAGSICSDSWITFLRPHLPFCNVGGGVGVGPPVPSARGLPICTALLSRAGGWGGGGGQSMPGTLLRAESSLPHLVLTAIRWSGYHYSWPAEAGHSAGGWQGFPDNRKGL